MQISRFQTPSMRTLNKPSAPPKTDPPEPPSRQAFLEGAQVGAAHFGVPAVAGLLIPAHGFLAGAVAGVAVSAVRAGGFSRENAGAMVSAGLIGAFAGHAGARFGLTGAVGAAGLGALYCGLQMVRNDMEGR
ncbi:MAG: hypothetical protein KF760_21375 [Candidatus Eremiobacteraeota bacterium]|nr:hypothetical protein [Candidatus Eremiobacteraeota bacterium]MCW5867554.1 hypothetical protein [Candidatus Eremiobacteraeota bacterium]